MPSLLERAAMAEISTVFSLLGTGPRGLSSEEAGHRLAQYGPNDVQPEGRPLGSIVRDQATNGINLLLAFAGLLTFVVGDPLDGGIVVLLLGLNVGLSILQEYRAERALEALRSLLPLRAHVWRDAIEVTLPARALVPGDVILVRSGDVVPADVRLLEADGLLVNQANVTGESLPQEKRVAPVRSGPPARWTNTLFAGTMVVGGKGRGVVVATGARTVFGETATMLRGLRTPSDFQVNLTRFGGFLLRFGLFLAVVVFLANALQGRGIVVSITLALALALGAVPEALPAVTATTLALGAAELARRKVLVRRLAAVEDLSVVDTLCVDKTGTITENRTVVTDVWTCVKAEDVLAAAVLCSTFPQRETDVVDEAIVAAAAAHGLPLAALARVPRETLIPFTSQQKRMCVAAQSPSGREVICKGAAAVILQHCARLLTPEGEVDLASRRTSVEAAMGELEQTGARVLAVAKHACVQHGTDHGEVDAALTLLGLIGLADPPRPDAAEALKRSEELGVRVKIVTGDAPRTAVAVAEQLGRPVRPTEVVDATALRDAGVQAVAESGQIFAEVVPADKYLLVRTLQANGHHVAVTGDGVNDAPALRAANVGIAMASGSDVAKSAADLVLLEDGLAVIVDGFAEGRRIFTNVNRYLLYTMVSNFANVFVVAVASLFLDFLPLLPGQILVLNLVADLPMLAVVTDRVAREDIAGPRHWDVRHLVEQSIYLGVTNALFAFGLLGLLDGQPPEVVHAAWFLLLGTSALLVLLVVRTPGWFWQAPSPSRAVALAVGAGLAVTVGLVNLPVAQGLLGFAALPWGAQLGIVVYALGYLLTANLVRRAFLHTLFARRQRT